MARSIGGRGQRQGRLDLRFLLARMGERGWQLTREATHGGRADGTNSQQQPTKRESMGSPPMASAINAAWRSVRARFWVSADADEGSAVRELQRRMLVRGDGEARWDTAGFAD